jgi:hypothetical protein
MFNVTKPRYKIKTLKSGDIDFTFSPDGIKIVARAGFEINKECPREYKLIIAECINNGWLKPIANMKESDFMWEKLGE